MNAGMVLSMGGFFSLMAIGLASALPSSMYNGLTTLGVNAGVGADDLADPAGRHAVRRVPRRQPDRAADAGGRPVRSCSPGTAPTSRRSPARRSSRTLISGPFKDGLTVAFAVSIAMLLIAAVASLFRGGKFVHPGDDDAPVHESIREAMAREGAAFDAAVLGAEVEYEATLSYGKHAAR